MKKLTPGANTTLNKTAFSVSFELPQSVDVSVFSLTSSGKVKGDAGMTFYGQPVSPCGSVKLEQGRVSFDLSKTAPDIEKLAVTATVDTGSFSSLSPFSLVSDDFSCDISTNSRSEAALILLEVYRRNGEWKVRFVDQGFNGGLKPLAEHFGVDIASDEPPAPTPPVATPTPPPPPPAPSQINLSKINLTKEKPKIDLTKSVGSIGLIRANLNWTKKQGGFFSSSVDLDLGAYIELLDGSKTIVQALGGNFEAEPYLKLLEDDRSGASTEGEWIHIEGNKLNDVQRIMIFAFIYEGAPNWAKTDAYVTIHVPDMPPIETRLSEGDAKKGFCAIAELKVNNGRVNVERVNRFFSGHKDCDEAFNWGFSWTKGSK